MKTLLITNASDTRVGMRLAGIEAVMVTSGEETLVRLKEAIENPQVGLVLLTDGIVDSCYEEVMALKLVEKDTMILTIPDPGQPFKDHIAQYVRESIGIKF
ncbi:MULTISPECIES: V-type ATP synthase subunit F [unclassified Fusibacter]|uniref:V-type ATP synthase subunit F n=1 Tax=unclassified Fusibacter TaxID=2624464 RepID=UPI001012B206|nr:MULTISPECIES: V-type ATP synthase subunit F [unclassified Fusibacter]MCK8059887.1 V-type ATP synthase subunit F [Fusibacter sp. A2]NPE21689.1 ATP synthase subunit F [Fusibacter sp. A1]RXV62092.1 ATP synthase subunit F [Fusibacter sp. A1]